LKFTHMASNTKPGRDHNPQCSTLESMKNTPDQSAQAPGEDTSHRFIFDDADIRGEIVHLKTTLHEIYAVHQYPAGVSQLLGEFIAAAVLLSSTLKYEGTLILQARSDGQIPLIMVECSNLQQVRAIVRGAEQATSTDFGTLLSNGQLAITIDPKNGQRYQSIVPLELESLAHSLNAYFEQSEQLATQFWLTCDGEKAAGMLLQQLPERATSALSPREEQWQHACSLAATTTAGELLKLSAEQLLHRLYHEDPVRMFDPSEVIFRCSCSRERTLGALATIDRAELEDILLEQGKITMDCEFCNQQYQYKQEDITALHISQKEDLEHRTLH
jgi:molecular chaperone Hsp33